MWAQLERKMGETDISFHLYACERGFLSFSITSLHHTHYGMLDQNQRLTSNSP